MTELEKEAQRAFDNRDVWYKVNAQESVFKEGYIEGAEPRDKRIAKLEAQMEKMECCGNCIHFNFNESNYCHKGVYRGRQYVCSEWVFGN